ncbi:hypothetical protein EXW94_25245 [Enterobacter sp. JMULE2]|uniref:hypothetical protein n=1 Tax=Enterobacter sp. JMULE2 TaxID=2518340 RepID=UPI001575DEDD|nr:hypothetical protein [Enterobacter sp. JMULE2]NTZ40908.1 hypothetical protein [Enterobacter sp. JMULE2]
MAKNTARSNVLLSTFVSLIPELELAGNESKKEDLRSVLLTHAENDNDIVIIHSDEAPVAIELRALKPLSKLGENLAANAQLFYVCMTEITVQKIGYTEALQLLKETPVVPSFKTLDDLNTFIVSEFANFGLETLLDVENLEYSLEKSNELRSPQLNNWLCDIIAQRDVLFLRQRFDNATKAHYDDVVQLYAAVRPLMSELGFPDSLKEHTFSELVVFSPKGWDNAIMPKMEFLAKREAQFKEDAKKQEQLEIIQLASDHPLVLQHSTNVAPSKYKMVAQAALALVVAVLVFNKFIF